MKRKLGFLLLLAGGMALLLAACSSGGTPQAPTTVEVTREVTRIVQVTVPAPPCPATPTPVVPYSDQVPDLIANSLHGTSRGMGYFYSAEQGGFEKITNIPYDQLGCKRCHVDSSPDKCNTCHLRHVGDSPPATTCYACHGRQKKGLLALHEQDVHLTSGGGKFTCTTCHDAEEVHGDGEMYHSLQEGAIKVQCTDCHSNPDLAKENVAHKTHFEDMECAACHMTNTLVCYNCHFDTEVEQHKKVAYGAFNNWKFLGVNDEGKITTATIMPIIYKDQTFVALAPYFDHSIRKPDVNTICTECHGSPAVKEYEDTGKITVTKWDTENNKMTYTQAVIPIPQDYQDALQFDFATITDWTDDGKPVWQYVKTGVDLWQMLYLKPLGEDQIPEPLPGMSSKP